MNTDPPKSCKHGEIGRCWPCADAEAALREQSWNDLFTETWDEQHASKNQAYTERNHLVAFLSCLYPSHLSRHDEDDETWDREWLSIVCVHAYMPESTDVIQMTWHIHDSHLPLFFHLRLDPTCTWDGHTTDEKYARLERLSKWLMWIQ